MKYQLLTLPDSVTEESPFYIEGVVLAANLTTKPTAPESWLNELFGEPANGVRGDVENQINQQFNYLKRGEYSLLSLVEDEKKHEQLADFAEGFMTLWPIVEEQWQEAEVGDGTLRMLQALLTTFMLAIDEEQTQQQMIASGFDTPPSLGDFIDQVDLMIGEVAQAADELMVGAKAQSVNPYKEIGRNDPCPCESGKKFKQCCGKNS